MKKYLYVSFFLVLISCGSPLYLPATASAESSLEQLKQGRELYVSHCASCHALHLPKQFNTKEWAVNLDLMQARAFISDDQKKLIYHYLINAPQ